MLKLFFLFSLSLSLSFSTISASQAQPPPPRGMSLEQDAYNLAAEIGSMSRYMTRDQRAKIETEFQAIRGILYNTQPSRRLDYTCVARDNDNRAPFVFAIREGLNMRRLNNVDSFQTLQACDTAVASITPLRELSLLCVSRDTDGRSPWVVSSLSPNGNVSKISHTYSSSMEYCQNIIKEMTSTSRQNLAYFCTSRDDDARGPFVAASVDLNTLSVQKGSENYSALTECRRFIGTAYTR